MEKVRVGDVIIATDENKELTVDHIWNNDISRVIDFSARYNESIGINQYGEPIHGIRGFSYRENNWILKKI